MRQRSTTWFQGWNILLRCAEFRCQDGALKYASTAILKHMPPTSDCTNLQWPDTIRRSIVFPEDAFGSQEDANIDATSKARRQILVMNGNDSLGRKIVENTGDTSTGQESDESLAAQYEISFDGRRYAFRQYQYDAFRDALDYAVAEHAKAGFVRNDAFQPSWRAAYHPTDEDESTMKMHGIAYIEGHFLYGGYRYGQLCDAIAFAAGHPNL
ncbi:hypothetical protein [Massilia endophytica]|uniref:hypothetical protein n=1 Tax=Massilia endophytica TaxID=2899220 RepID=UPI001E2D1661|nr:hypothetical protein [Massilia endophytica]UGQ48820.1 hypothetical protein LSQ66_10275 [Massilia endophytica]